MRKAIFRGAAVTTLVLLPFFIRLVYVQLTALPRAVTFATGPVDGRYQQICKAIQAELNEKHPGIEVNLIETSGSLENLRLLQSGQADFALYQPNTEAILAGAQPGEHNEIAFVSNLYSEVAHFIVHNDSGINGPGDLVQQHNVAIGNLESGDYAMSRMLLEHFGIAEQDLQVRRFNYLQIEQGLEDGSLDAAFVTAGIHAPVFRTLFADGHCRLVDVPHADALSARHLAVAPYTVPAGLYRSRTPTVPAQDVETVALRAQLLTRSETDSGLVKAVTGIVISQRFVTQQTLTELFAGGTTFARETPEFTPHPATADVFDPHLRPLLDSDFVEATEGMRSFVVSVLIAGYLAFRWFRQRQARSKEHRLDQHIRGMLEIERKQLDLDQTDGSNDLAPLQALLDEVTSLRQNALAELTAHELNEDRAADTFLEMAHALSDKINAKISRQRLDKQFNNLTAALRPPNQQPSPPGRGTASKPQANEAG